MHACLTGHVCTRMMPPARCDGAHGPEPSHCCDGHEQLTGESCGQVSLAADFLWNWNTREANAAFGYDYILRQCRLRGRIDTDGKVCHLRICC